MSWGDYWGALTARQRIGLSGAALIVVAATFAAGVWLLRDPYVALASSLSGERMSEMTQALDAAKLNYRIDAGGVSISVEQSQLGKARAAVSGGQFGASLNVGLELFKETDFSSTDFAQRINYQRALQGELTRTIQTIAGVRSVRVHVVLAEAGLFKRNGAKATAAVELATQPGRQLTSIQVRGIQRLVAASVPEIKVEDVVVLDESGASLTRAAAAGEGELSSSQLDLKRQVDQYLESKLQRLLQDLMPQGVVSLSVDAALDEKQLRVTTDEPIAARTGKDVPRATGVVVKERQSQHGGASGYMQAAGDAPDSDNTDWEYEYSVGRRTEQTISSPGSIRRVSVAVALHGAPAELTSSAIEQLVGTAVGLDRSRGDSVTVLLLPSLQQEPMHETIEPAMPRPADSGTAAVPLALKMNTTVDYVIASACLLALLLAALVVGIRSSARARSRATLSDEDLEAVTVEVRQWLDEGADHGR